MAKEQQPLQRQILTPTQTVSAGNSFERLGQAVGQVGELANKKFTEIAVTQAAQEGALDAERGELPKDLAFPLTKATEAYNKAGAAIEADRMITSAQSQVQQTLVEMTNPATFNRNTPAEFQARLEGIVEGTLDNTRDQNRAEVANQLTKIGSKASLQMLQQSIQFDNVQTKHDAQVDLNNIQVQLRDAVIAGRTEEAEGLRSKWFEKLNNWGELNNEIARQAPELREQFQKTQLVNQQLGDYSKASSEGKGPEFLAGFVENKDNLPFDVWQKAANQLVSLQGTEQKLIHEVNAQELQQAKNAIDNNTLTDPDDLLDLPNLTTRQHIDLMGRLENQKRKQFKSQEKFIKAQNHILRNQSALISGSTADEMLDTLSPGFEQANGRPMALTDMIESQQGTNAFPMSRLEGVRYGRDVPAINAQMTNQLLSNNPTLVREAAESFNRVVNVDKRANDINISGRALSIATLFNSLNKGIEDPNVLAQRVHDTVMNVSENEFNTRVENYNREFRVNPRTGKSKLDKKFKELTGINPQLFKTDAAMDFFKSEHRISFLNSNSEQAADKETAYKMRAWQTSPYFDDGVYSLGAPQVVTNLTEVGNTFDNQYRLRVQEVINFNKKQRDAGVNVPVIEWISPSEQEIKDFDKMTDDQKVFNKFGQSTEREQLASVGQFPRPQIKVNGQPTELVLVSTPETQLSDRAQWALFYKDKFGNNQPIPDTTMRGTGVAMFSTVGLERWAPSFFEGEKQEQLKKTALNIEKNQALQELNSITKERLGSLSFFGLMKAALPEEGRNEKYMRDQDRTLEAFRHFFSSDPGELKNKFAAKIAKRHGNSAIQNLTQAKETSEQASVADNVGISADTGEDVPTQREINNPKKVTKVLKKGRD